MSNQTSKKRVYDVVDLRRFAEELLALENKPGASADDFYRVTRFVVRGLQEAADIIDDARYHNGELEHIAKEDVQGAVRAEIDRLWAEALDMDDAWPLPDVMSKLIEATEHLLSVHQCDTHGHEEYRYATQRGKAILHNLRARPADETSG